MTFGPSTRKGQIHFEKNFSCLVMYDTEESFNDPKDLNTIVAIFDKSTLLDFNKIVSCNSETDPNALEIKLIQLQELLQRDIDKASQHIDRIKDIRHLCLKGGKQSTVVLRESGQADLYWNCKLVASSDDAVI